eukprot:COSAG06_NODE_2341_length_7051_cov_73.733458_7_plen_166_part_00
MAQKRPLLLTERHRHAEVEDDSNQDRFPLPKRRHEEALRGGGGTRLSFSAFVHVCPEPALAKRSVRYEHGSKKGVFRTKKRMLSCLGWTGLPSGVSSGASELQRDPKTLHGKNVRKKDLEGTQRKHRTHESRTSHTHTASTQPLWPASCYLGLVRSHTLSLSIYT